MTNAIYFHTPGPIPMESFTTFGLNAKPRTDNPLGEFGTGLKYAVAVLLRVGGQMTIFVGGTEYDFYTSDKDFRGKEFKECRMRKRSRLAGFVPARWRSVALPYTTHLGKKWLPWQVFRELASNTYDEGGLVTDEEFNPWPGGTTIRVVCDKITEIYLDQTKVFMDNGGEAPLWENGAVEIYRGESQNLFYRGVRVYDLRNKSRFTYNFKKGMVNLTEDRSAGNVWDLQWKLASIIQNEIFDRLLLRDMMDKRDHATFEGEDLSFDYRPSGTSIEFLHTATSLGSGASRSASNFATVYRSKTSNQMPSLSLPTEQWSLVAQAVEADQALQETEVGRDILRKIYKLLGKAIYEEVGDIPF